jgi:hypothetical protein
MSTDLFDDAKRVRDAATSEYERVRDPATEEALTEGYRIGIHLTAVMMVATAKRLQGASGPVRSDHLMHMVALAIANVLSHAACAYRPVCDGVPLAPSVNLYHLNELVYAYAEHQVAQNEAGAQDFIVPFEFGADGSIGVKGFDFQNMLKKGGAS